MSLLDTAMAFHTAGCCCIPASNDGSKSPYGTWKQYQTVRPTPAQVMEWFIGGWPGMGIVTGAVSGGLEMLEFEGRARPIMADVLALMTAAGLSELWDRIFAGYTEGTPGGGVHLLYRVAGMDVPGNTKLARRPATADELAVNPDEKVKVLIETRGEGGFVIVAPSSGTVHPSGRPWIILAGGPQTIPTITADEHRELWRIMRTFDEMPVTTPAVTPLCTVPTPDRNGSTDMASVSPGADYEATVTWPEILLPHGWTEVYRRGDVTYWCRPGKQSAVSATTGYGSGDWLLVFSTSTNFESERTYTKFGAYTVLNHGGDHARAASELRRAGYGSAPVAAVVPALSAFQYLPDALGLVANGALVPVATTKERLGILTRAELSTLPAPEPLIEGTLDRRTLSVLAGHWGTGKTFVALDWACSIAAGRRWQGRRTVTPAGTPVLYVAAEGAYGLAQRVDAWEQGWKADAGSLYVRPCPVNLYTGEGLADLCVFIAEYRPAFVVIDTVARCAVGADENNAKDMGVMVRALDLIKDATGDGTVLAVHHTGKNRTTIRGSSALESSADTVYLMEGDSLLLTMTRTKRKDGPVEDTSLLTLRNIARSCVVESANSENPMASAFLAPSGHSAAQTLWDVFGTSGASRAQFRDACMDRGMSRSSAYRAMNDLVKAGEARMEGMGHSTWYTPTGPPKIPASQRNPTASQPPPPTYPPPPV